jgi:hypothetical protein
LRLVIVVDENTIPPERRFVNNFKAAFWHLLLGPAPGFRLKTGDVGHLPVQTHVHRIRIGIIRIASDPDSVGRRGNEVDQVFNLGAIGEVGRRIEGVRIRQGVQVGSAGVTNLRTGQ